MFTELDDMDSDSDDMSWICPAANDHKASGSGTTVIELSSDEE